MMHSIKTNGVTNEKRDVMKGTDLSQMGEEFYDLRFAIRAFRKQTHVENQEKYQGQQHTFECDRYGIQRSPIWYGCIIEALNLFDVFLHESENLKIIKL
jgi:DnaJ-domain-containing protein 1